MAMTVSEEQRQQTRQMDVESLAKFVFRYLKENLNSAPKYDDYLSVVDLRIALFPDKPEHQFNDDHSKLLEAIALLERRGLVVRDSSPLKPLGNTIGPPPTMSIVNVYLTSIGMKSDIDDEILLLVDKSQEIVDKLEQKIGTLDDVVQQYYLESIRAYQEELYISSVICLGAASERAIHCLAEAIESNSEKYQKGIKNKRNGNIGALTKYLSDTVIPNIFVDDKTFATELRNRLDGLADIYRENRNDAGHPTRIVDQSWLRDDQDRLLIHFRKYITTIYKAIDECRANSKPTTENS